MPASSLEVHVAEHEMPDPSRSVVAMEPISVIEADVAEQRDLHPEPDARTGLEVGLDLEAQVPDVARVEEQYTMEGMGDRELLFQREQREIASARVADLLLHEVR